MNLTKITFDSVEIGEQLLYRNNKGCIIDCIKVGIGKAKLSPTIAIGGLLISDFEFYTGNYQTVYIIDRKEDKK